MSISTKAANNIRILSAAMVEKAKSGHPGGAMGGADFINILYSEFLRFDPDSPSWKHRDRFFMDPGHMSPMLYSQLSLLGFYSMEDLSNFRQWGSPTPGHPEKDFDRGVENTSGPLGQGHVNAVGSAIAERFLVARFGEWMSHKTYAFISDGGMQEEIAHSAARIAGHLGLSNLIMFYDSNDIQLSHKVEATMSEDVAAKYEAMHWNTVTINGNNEEEIRKALWKAQDSDKPFLIIGKTTMGLGARTDEGGSFEGQVSTHGQPLSKAGASISATISNLGGDPENPFQIFDDVARFYDEVKEEKRRLVAEHHQIESDWASQNAQLATKLDFFFSENLPDIDWESLEQKPDAATRNASATVLSHFADTVENMIVMSADLANSDKTDAFLKKTKAFEKGDFSGAFLQVGVSELTMAAIANGMALHGGIIPVCGTFFVFSDFMKPAVRLAALMELPVKYVWTHDAFRVGEDGPTHQPVEQEAQIRLLEKVKNHHGKRSMLVLRPADAEETTIAWKMALESKHAPSCLILSRQNIKNLPRDNKAAAKATERGAYIVEKADNPDVVLVANGSEVATLVEGAALLRERKNLSVQIVSAPSEGVFREQDAAYQQEVLPVGVPTFGMTAGLPVALEGLVGPHGKVFGLDHFGYSAPYTVLDEKFGFTGEKVYAEVEAFLKS